MESKDENCDNTFNPEFVYSASPTHERINSTDDIFQFPDIQNLAEPASPLHFTDNIVPVNYEHNTYRLQEGSISPLGIQNMLGFGGANFQNNVVTAPNNNNGTLKISRADENNAGNHDDYNNSIRNCDDFINGIGTSDDHLHKWDLSIESQFGTSIVGGDFNVINQELPFQLHHENIESLKTLSKKPTHRNDTVMGTSQIVPQLYNLSDLKTGLEMKVAKDKTKSNEDIVTKRKSNKGPKKTGYSGINNTSEAPRNDVINQSTKPISKGIVDRISYMMMDPNEESVNQAPIMLPKQAISSLLAELRSAPPPTTSRLIPPSFNRPSSTFPTNRHDSEPSEYDHEPSPDREADYPPRHHPYYDRRQPHLPPTSEHFQDSHPTTSNHLPGNRFPRRTSYPMPPHHYSHYGGVPEEYDHTTNYAPRYYDPYYDPRNRQTADYHQHHFRAYYEGEAEETFQHKRARGNMDDHNQTIRRGKIVSQSSKLLGGATKKDIVTSVVDVTVTDNNDNDNSHQALPLSSSQSKIPVENDENVNVIDKNDSKGLHRITKETVTSVETFDPDQHSQVVPPTTNITTTTTTTTTDHDKSCDGDGDNNGIANSEEVEEEEEDEVEEDEIDPRNKSLSYPHYLEENDRPPPPFTRKLPRYSSVYPPPPFPYETTTYPPNGHHYKRSREENNEEDYDDDDDGDVDDVSAEKSTMGLQNPQPVGKKPGQRYATASNASGPSPYEIASKYQNDAYQRRFSGMSMNNRNPMNWNGNGNGGTTIAAGRGSGRGGGNGYTTLHGKVLDTMGIQGNNSNMRYNSHPSKGNTNTTMMVMPHPSTADTRKVPRTKSNVRGRGGMISGPPDTTSTSKATTGRQPCSCKKSGCLKLYCECFRQQMVCDGCYCHNCSNLESNSLERTIAAREILRRDPDAFMYRPELSVHDKQRNNLPGCSCKKSSCLKKYCECFNSNVMCTIRCRCLDCRNMSAVSTTFQEEEEEQQQEYENEEEEDEEEEEYHMEALPSRTITSAPNATASRQYPRPTNSNSRNLNIPIKKINSNNNAKGSRISNNYPTNEEVASSPTSSPTASTTSMEQSSTAISTSLPHLSSYPTIPPPTEVISFNRDGGLSFFGVALGDGAKLAFNSAINRLGNAQLSEFITNALFVAAQDPNVAPSYNNNNNNNNYQQQQNSMDGNNAMNTTYTTTAIDPNHPSNTTTMATTTTTASTSNDNIEIRRDSSDLDIDITEDDFQ